MSIYKDNHLRLKIRMRVLRHSTFLRQRQMSCHPAIESKVKFGEAAEVLLLPVLSDFLHDPLQKTSDVLGVFDFWGDKTVSDLKTRTSDWDYRDAKILREGWLIPSCKILEGWNQIAAGKRVFFFYFWMKDKTLWVHELQADEFTKGGHFIPKGHYDQMLHVAIHQDRWTQIWTAPESILFEENSCWIE